MPDTPRRRQARSRSEEDGLDPPNGGIPPTVAGPGENEQDKAEREALTEPDHDSTIADFLADEDI